MKFAVIKTGGKQYEVKEGQELKIEKIEGKAGTKLVFDEVLLHCNEGGEVAIGSPLLEGEEVRAEIIEQGKAKKIIVFKYKPKKHYKKKQGHRQPYTLVKILQIGKAKKPSKPKAKSGQTSKKATTKKTPA